MKRIVVCCDGTWRRLDAEQGTNVVQVATAVLPQAPDGVAQLVVHLDGVGSGRGATRVARRLDRWLGGAFGAGLDDGLADAYRLLVFNYEPGDEIYLFGYSRGAFTARSLAGLIRKCGILSRRHAARIGEALALYRDRDPGKHPDAGPMRRFRASFAPETALDAADQALRMAEGQPPGEILRIAYVGVWDTVGALGVPGFLTAEPLLNHRRQFHDTDLSSKVRAARHAVSVDERRRSFAPTLWTNVSELNVGASGSGAPYQQRWFPGVHGAVGGGAPDRRLSSLALLWVLEGAERLGLAIDPDCRERFVAEGDAVLGALDPAGAPSPLAASLSDVFAKDRDGPKPGEREALSESVVTRWRGDGTYRPPTLAGVRDILDAPPPAPVVDPRVPVEA